jgi:KDO2-lipid IV(A) lauroyltransferase
LRRRGALRNWTEYALARLVLGSVAAAPGALAGAVALSAVTLGGQLAPRLRRTALRNLALAMPELDLATRERIAGGVFQSLARLVATLAKLPRLNRSNIGELIRYEGYEHFKAALARGRGVIFATAHLGNWELSAYAHALMAQPMHVVVRPLDNPLLDRFLARRRAVSGNSVIEKKDFARGILRALAANQAVGILVDQNTALDEGVFVDFFRIPACTHPGLARVAAHSGAAVIPGFAVWEDSERRYVLRFLPPLEISGDTVADTQRVQAAVESMIRRYPDQWLWIHRRWKTRPPGEPELYE